MSITFIAKLGGKYTVPEGAIILMPTESNPVGFARFSSMDSYCLAAADSTDATVVGLNPHTHPVSISSIGAAGAHTHIASGTSGACNASNKVFNYGASMAFATSNHTHVVSITTSEGSSSHQHALSSSISGAKTWQPPFRGLVAYKANTSSSVLPNNAIMMWWGTDSGTLPNKFKICNGANGTPNMKKTYLTFYGSQVTGGDWNSHNHTAGALASGGSHTHAVSGNSAAGGVTTVNTDWITPFAGIGSHSHGVNYTTSAAGAHTHADATIGESPAPIDFTPALAVFFVQYQEA